MNDIDFSKEFISGNTIISRELLESLPCPFKTDDVSDETMQGIADIVEAEMKPWYDWKRDGSITKYKCDEHWWEVLESVLVDNGVPYYEDVE